MERGNRWLRALDRWGGIPLVFILGLLRGKRALPRKVETIGLLMFGSIGDALIAGAVVGDLRRHYPDAEIVGFVSEANGAISLLLDGIDEWRRVPVTRPLAMLSIIRRYPLDLMIDFGQWARINAAVSALAQARFTVGLRKKGQFRHFAYDAISEHRNDRHELENYRGLIRCLGILPSGRPQVRPDLVRQPLPGALRRPFVVCHPWASGFRHDMREWPTGHWVELARHLIARGIAVVVSGGPADGEKSLALAAALDDPRVTVLAGRGSLPELVAILAQAAAVVSVNTGIMHLAAALDCPMVALHGPTDPLRWGPLSDRAVTLLPPTGRQAYLDLGFEYPPDATNTMGAISVAEVLSHVDRLLQTAPERPVPAASESA